ncbi:MAG: class I SAM-dependent methyltransferase [Nitrospira sp.]|nr:class I SAM-dependent methyltransferase [Nitrospira sp.]
MSVDANDEIRTSLQDHLSWWGLRHVTSDRDYFLWQRQQLSVEELNQLNIHAERKHTGDHADETAFYNLAAHPTIFPVLYSQRYEYYEAIGLRAIAHLGKARDILDFGCGLGILTTLYARRFPDANLVGIDRSAASIAIAQRKAKELGLRNLRFICLDIEREPLSGSFDLVLATHALLQAEQDTGIPSESWRTFDRGHDPSQQMAFEQRTGLASRLDPLCQVLRPHGRMIVSEKTRQLARRVPFQRALAGRGLQLMQPADPIQYRSIEEVVEDGPFYVLSNEAQAATAWDELPELDDGTLFTLNAMLAHTSDSTEPLYENHGPSAQVAWEELPERTVTQELTREEPDGRQVHVELGIVDETHYLYCANTFDQRQLVMMEEARASILESYYQEILRGLP